MASPIVERETCLLPSRIFRAIGDRMLKRSDRRNDELHMVLMGESFHRGKPVDQLLRSHGLGHGNRIGAGQAYIVSSLEGDDISCTGLRQHVPTEACHCCFAWNRRSVSATVMQHAIAGDAEIDDRWRSIP